MCYGPPMKVNKLTTSLVFISLVSVFTAILPVTAHAFDIRGVWVGKAKGSIFGAEGSVTITQQDGENLYGIVEGGNFLGKARFSIQGKIRGNQIYGEKQGNVFQGFLFGDGTIRGAVRTTDGDTYRVFLRRPYPSWGGYPQPQW